MSITRFLTFHIHSYSLCSQAAVAKYVAAELQKCNLGETKAMSENLTCSGKTPTSVAKASADALADFKNQQK